MARKWTPATDADLDRQIAEARRNSQILSPTEPRALSARLNRDTGRIEIELRDGTMVAIPTRLMQGLRGKPAAAVAKVYVAGPAGYALHWDELDVHFTVAGLVAGRLGTSVWMREHARAAGSVRSAAKARAARRNGKKGGRPKTRT